MASEVGYDSFAEIYDIWMTARPIAKPNLDFYVAEASNTKGPVVELGVGTGRVAIELANKGCEVVGIDASKPMLEKCAKHAAAAGVAGKISLVEADFRSFSLPKKSSLILIPFHGIGHLLTLENMDACFKHIHQWLVGGGQLIFDHIMFDVETARKRPSTPKLRCEYHDAVSGAPSRLWAKDDYDFEGQKVRVNAWTERLDERGNVKSRKDFSLDYSWVLPEQFRSLLNDSGFTISASYGDYLRHPLTPQSKEQIWIATK